MPFIKGQSGNPAGRPKGVQTKVTQALRATITDFVSANLKDIQNQYNELDAAQKLSFLEKLLSYALPKLQSVQMDVTTDINKLSDEQVDYILNQLTNDK